MFKKIERQLKLFTEGTGLADRHEIVHGTLYVKLKDDKNCDFFHAELRGFYRQFISCLLYTSPSPRDRQKSRMPSSA